MKLLKGFGADAGIKIFGLAHVSDDWVNQLKTYHKVDVTPSNTEMMRFTMTAMYVELFIARLEDLLTPKEKAILEHEVMEKIVHMFEILDFLGQEEAKDKAEHMENMLIELISSHRENEVKYNITIPQTYAASFARSFKDIPEQFLTEYIDMKVQLLEDEKLRQKFMCELDR
jgi:hypothetical protein